MFLEEDKAFVEACVSGNKSKNYIDNILETAKLLDALYTSAGEKKEINF